jgi:hypothetical protein
VIYSDMFIFNTAVRLTDLVDVLFRPLSNYKDRYIPSTFNFFNCFGSTHDSGAFNKHSFVI